ncbi:MAG: CARDB domain-containing protein [Gaiellaceae bacterium]
MRVQVFAAAFAIVFTGSAIAFAATGARVRARPDLVVTSISNPPAVVFQGNSFKVHDRTRDIGGRAAGRTVTQYYLVSTTSGQRTPAGRRSVARLRPGRASLGTGTVRALPSLAFGTYSLVACADGGHAVSESNEHNNCRTAATTVIIKKPPPPA